MTVMLADMFVQYGGQLAIGKVLKGHDSGAVDGVLNYSISGKTLDIDFSDARWVLGRGSAGAPEEIAARSEIANLFLGVDPDQVERVTIAASNAGVAVQMHAAEDINKYAA